MKGLYSIYYATDYRGGDLEVTLNITREKVIEEYFEPYFCHLFDNVLLEDEIITFEGIKDSLLLAREHCDVYDVYAGYTGQSEPEIYQVIDNHLEQINPFGELFEDGIKWVMDAIEKERERRKNENQSN